MSFNRAKFFSGLLSVTALASMTAAPAMANEAMPGEGGQEDLFALSPGGEDAESSGIAAFLGEDALSEKVRDGGADALSAAFPGVGADAIEDEIEQSGPVQDVPFADDWLAGASADADAPDGGDSPVCAMDRALASYNAAVLPELRVSLARGNVYTAILEEAPDDPFAGPSASCEVAAQDQAPEAADRKLVVASPNVYLNIHADPSLSSEVVGKMYGNDVAVALHREDDRWTKIRSGNIVGYVMNAYLVDGVQARALSEIVGTQVATVEAGKGTEVHQEASEAAKVITQVSEGDQYEVTEGEDGWLGILTEDGEGYIPASEVTLSMAYPVAESSRAEAHRMGHSNVKERADHEERKAQKAGAVVELAKARAGLASERDEETAMAVVEVALRAADAAAAQANVAQVAVSQAGAESGQAVIDFALQYVGNPYVWGGSSLTHGADCSGFVMAVYGNFGFRLPHYDVSDRSVGSPVASLEEARAGDIICYNGHVALYMGDGMIVHAQDERHGITTSNATFMHIVCIRRLFN